MRENSRRARAIALAAASVALVVVVAITAHGNKRRVAPVTENKPPPRWAAPPPSARPGVIDLAQLRRKLPGSTFWRDHLAFRDWLRTHPEAAAAYIALKTRLARQYPADREAYIRGKTSFVEGVLHAAR